MNFDQGFAQLLKHEGGYSDHAADPGGKTRYGVTEGVARQVGYRGDMRDLPLDLAKRIYRDRYWDAVRADELPAPVRFDLFDAAVNSGPVQAVKWLQRAVNILDDGIVGPKTLYTVSAAEPHYVCKRFNAERLRFMANLATWPSFGRGWARRIADNLGL